MTKSFLRILSVLFCAVMIISWGMLSASAHEGALVNGVEVNVGDTFTYTFNISDAEQEIVGMQMNLFYDREVLELVKVTDGVLDGTSTINDDVNKDGRIVFLNPFMNGGGLNCKEETVVATATFKVKSPAETEITYFMQYLYDIDMADIYAYKFTCDILSSETVISQGETPILADSSLTDSLKEEDNFQNNEEGRGDGIKNELTAPATQPLPTDTESETVTGETENSQTGSKEENTSSEETRNNEKKPAEKKKSGDSGDDAETFRIVLVVGAVALIIVAASVILLITLNKKRNQK